jgi:superfamily II DNA or RNA helicase
MSKVFSWYIGNVVYALQSKADNAVRVVMKRFMDYDDSYSEEPESYGGSLNTSRMINNITRFEPRTVMIVQLLLDIMRVTPSRRSLILSDRLDHLDDMKKKITTFSDGKVTCGMYVGGMKARDLAESEKRQVILATFNFASEGFDVPGLDTLVLASPKTDIEQSIGRILRQKAADRINVPLVLDIVDAFSVFEGQAKKRKTFYNKRGYSLQTVREKETPEFSCGAPNINTRQQKKMEKEEEEDQRDEDERGCKGVPEHYAFVGDG